MPELGTADLACAPPRTTTPRDCSAARNPIERNLRGEVSAGRNGS
jgi:hypothetical protein